MRFRSRFQKPLIVAGTLLLVFTLLSLSVQRSPVVQKLEGLIISLTAPGLQALRSVGAGLKRVWTGYFFLVGLQKENQILRQRLEEAEQQEARYQEALKTVQRLEALLDLKRQLALPVIGARIVAYDPSLWSRAAIIDQGKAAGVEVGQAVVAPAGIVGRIVEVYPRHAKVMLIVDRLSGADAMIQRTRVRGILQGKGANRSALEYVPKSADVQVGDLVVSSGLGGIYPPGLVFGKVTAANKRGAGVFQDIEVLPAVDLAALEEVLVVKTARLSLTP